MSAPLVIINKVNSVEEEVIAYSNNSRYGLQAGVYTENIHTALMAVDELEVGGVIINDMQTFKLMWRANTYIKLLF